MAPATIAAIYKKRWQIELLFKRNQTKYPLKYFLGIAKTLSGYRYGVLNR